MKIENEYIWTMIVRWNYVTNVIKNALLSVRKVGGIGTFYRLVIRFERMRSICFSFRKIDIEAKETIFD